MFGAFLSRKVIAVDPFRRARVELQESQYVRTRREIREESNKERARHQLESEKIGQQNVRMLVALDTVSIDTVFWNAFSSALYPESYFSALTLGVKPELSFLIPSRGERGDRVCHVAGGGDVFEAGKALRRVPVDQSCPNEDTIPEILERTLDLVEAEKVDSLLLIAGKADDERSVDLARKLARKGVRLFVLDCAAKTDASSLLSAIASEGAGVYVQFKKYDVPEFEGLLKLFGLASCDCLPHAQREVDGLALSGSAREMWEEYVKTFPHRPSVLQCRSPILARRREP